MIKNEAENTTTLSTEVAKIPEASFRKNSFKVPLNCTELNYYFSPSDSPVKFYFLHTLNEHTPTVKYVELRRANMRGMRAEGAVEVGHLSSVRESNTRNK